MSKKKETDANESYRLEIEIASVLLGFLFVMDSIILTMPDTVLTIAKDTSIYYFLGISSMSFGTLFSLASLYCSLALLVAIPFYFFYIQLRKEVILLTARTFLAISIYLMVILIVIINGVFMARLVGTQSNAYMNPISGYVFAISVTSMLIFILASWTVWVIKNYRRLITHLKGRKG